MGPDGGDQRQPLYVVVKRSWEAGSVAGRLAGAGTSGYEF